MTAQFEEIVLALESYFDGLHMSDSALLRKVFHPNAIYACATEIPFRYLMMEEYFSIVDQRPSPASRGEMRRDRVVGIEFAGEQTAMVKATCLIGDRSFTDFLSMVHLDGRWLIIAKIFHFDVA